jgi:ankyrin repeat protein
MQNKTNVLFIVRVQVWISVFMSCIMLCACAGQPGRSDGSFTGMMPSGQGWVVHEANGANVILGKITGRGMQHSVIAFATFERILETIEEPGPTRRDIRNAAELLRYVNKIKAIEYQGSRFKNADIKGSIVRYVGNDCVRVDFAAEDHEVPAARGAFLILAGRDYLCLHPASTESAALAVRLSLSQRYVQGTVPLSLDAEIDPFFKNYIEGSAMPFIKAAKEGDIETVQRLVVAGIDVNAKADGISDWGKTALMEASLRGHVDLVKVLLKAGAEVNAKDDYGDTALMFASGKGNDDIVKLLLGAGANANIQNTGDGSTALIIGAKNGYAGIVQLLLESGADVNIKAKAGTALLGASWRGAIPVIEALIEKSADVNVKDPMGMTALMYAAGDGRTSIVKKLIEKGADVNARNRFGHTPLSFAQSTGRDEVIRILKSAGAKE